MLWHIFAFTLKYIFLNWTKLNHYTFHVYILEFSSKLAIRYMIQNDKCSYKPVQIVCNHHRYSGSERCSNFMIIQLRTQLQFCGLCKFITIQLHCYHVSTLHCWCMYVNHRSYLLHNRQLEAFTQPVEIFCRNFSTDPTHSSRVHVQPVWGTAWNFLRIKLKHTNRHHEQCSFFYTKRNRFHSIWYFHKRESQALANEAHLHVSELIICRHANYLHEKPYLICTRTQYYTSVHRVNKLFL